MCAFLARRRKQIAVFAGCCACGKGTTIGAYIKKYGGVHISSSLLIEQSQDPEEAAKIAGGIMCDDAKVTHLVETALLHKDCNGLSLLDGFWRYEPQYDWLQQFCHRVGAELYTIYPEIAKESAREWYEDRIVCEDVKCKTPHSLSQRPVRCTVCASRLVLRPDHNKFDRRYDDFERLVLPLVAPGGRARVETPFLTFDAKLPVDDKVDMIHEFLTTGAVPVAVEASVSASACV
jgi:adenylate kinase family enzyme